jgi:hypothetical protein
MNTERALADLSWSVAVIYGLARLAATIGSWPRNVPADCVAQKSAASHLEEQVHRAVFGASALALGMAGWFRHQHIAVQALLWTASGLLVLAWLVEFVRTGLANEPRPRHLVRYALCARVATWATAAAGAITVTPAVLEGDLGAWLLAVIAATYMAARSYTAVQEAAEDVLGAGGSGLELDEQRPVI